MNSSTSIKSRGRVHSGWCIALIKLIKVRGPFQALKIIPLSVCIQTFKGIDNRNVLLNVDIS